MLKPNNQDRRWQILDSEYLIRRPWLTARKDRVRLPNGVENNEYYILELRVVINVLTNVNSIFTNICAFETEKMTNNLFDQSIASAN